MNRNEIEYIIKNVWEKNDHIWLLADSTQKLSTILKSAKHFNLNSKSVTKKIKFGANSVIFLGNIPNPGRLKISINFKKVFMLFILLTFN